MSLFRILIALTLLPMSGCFDFGKDDASEGDAGPAYANFCSVLESDGGDMTVELTVSNGDIKSVLTAVTGDCSTPPDADAGCAEIPSGSDVSVKLTGDKRSLLKTYMPIEANGVYSFYLTVDTDSMPILYTRDLSEAKLGCGSAMCVNLMYTPATCAAEDPCGWTNDGTCDELCAEFTADPFDDSADCSN